jgi:hypothetical protein
VLPQLVDEHVGHGRERGGEADRPVHSYWNAERIRENSPCSGPATSSPRSWAN